MSSIEQKIVLGTVFFVGLLLLVGWVLIKEEARMAEFTQQFDSRSIERGATLFETHCSTCHGPQGLGSAGRAPALNNPRLFDVTRGDDSVGRLEEVGWPGSLQDYIENAIAAGRPNSAAYWPSAMPTWGEVYGGPLRGDQVNDLVNFVMNWESTATDAENPPQIVQDFVMPGQAAAAPSEGAVGTDVTAILESLPEGDPANGETLYQQNGCAGCHQSTGDAAPIGPPTAGTASRVEQRIADDPALAGYTLQHYLVESIVNPTAYVVESYQPLMPQTFDESLEAQELADLVAYLAAQTQEATQ